MSLGQIAPTYLPFDGGKFRLTMGLTPLPDQAWFEFGEDLAAHLAAKRALLKSRPNDVFLALPEADAPAAELLGVLAAHLPRFHPTLFSVAGDHLCNTTTAESWNFGRPSLHPLDIAGRLVAEDLCLLQSSGGCHILVGASLCSPARWRLSEKIGQPLSAIHEPVPGYEDALGQRVEHFFTALKPDRLVGRFNWGIADDPAPFQPVAPITQFAVTPSNAGEQLWLRVERQTLRRLPKTGAVVFTIRTYITRLDRAVHSSAVAQDLAAAIRDMPLAMQAYKRIAPYAAALLAWLDMRAKI